MSKIYLFISNSDGYDPIHSITKCNKQIYKTKDEALFQLEVDRREDPAVIFEIDPEKLTIDLVEMR